MLTYRRATSEDVPALVNLLKLTFDHDARCFDEREHGVTQGYDSQEAQEKLVKNAYYFKILRDGQLVGGIVVQPITPFHCYLTHLFVAPEHQNCGIGTHAMELAELVFPLVRTWTLNTQA